MSIKPVTTAELLQHIQAGRARWEALLVCACAGAAHMTAPGLPGGWSVKDVIAHIAWFEREMVGLPPDWVLWQVIAQNSYEHYRQHEPDLQAWLAQVEAAA